MQCQGYNKNCKNCGRHFSKYEHYKECPDCGADLSCTKNAVSGYNLCERHGGPNPKNDFYGIGNPIVSGKTSHFPLTRLASKYAEMQRDGRIMTNRLSIEIVRERIQELLKRIDTEEAPQRMAKLNKLWKQFYPLFKTGQDMDAHTVAKQLDAEFEAAYQDYVAWKQIFEAVDLDRRLIESEAKVAKAMKAILTAEEAYELVAEIFAVIINIEDDPKKLKRYQFELTRLVGDGSVVEAERSDEKDTIDL